MEGQWEFAMVMIKDESKMAETKIGREEDYEGKKEARRGGISFSELL